jgi:hypothetical protein
MVNNPSLALAMIKQGQGTEENPDAAAGETTTLDKRRGKHAGRTWIQTVRKGDKLRILI